VGRKLPLTVEGVSKEIFTIGHSNRSLEEFAEILLVYEIKLLADVRALPGSARFPHFDADNLKEQLAPLGIRYRHFKALGGRRRARSDSANSAWRNASFRGYADYMQSEPFLQALDRLCALAEKKRVCLMCAEAVPWRCHRSLIADALLARGIRTIEIFGIPQNRVHKLPPWGKIQRGKVTYPGKIKGA
jgi:uncharacterized protein (DUF488 family)